MKKLLINSLIKNCGKTAYINRGISISYRELLEEASKLSEKLERQGTGPVVLYGHKSGLMITGIVACILAERAYVPVDISVPTERIDNIISQSGASLILNCGENVCPVRHDLCSDLLFDETVKSEPEEVKKTGTDLLYGRTAYIIFTSGSTGTPKGIPVSCSSLYNFCNWISNIDGLKNCRDETVLNQANFNFDLSVADIFFSLTNGHKLIGPDRDELADLNVLFKMMTDERVSVMVITPSFLGMLLTCPEFCKANFPNIKCIYLCGETLLKKQAEKTLERFPDIKLINAYGPTEATSAISSVVITDDIINKYDCLPMGVLSETATDVLIENGEIVLSGPSVFEGYLGQLSGGYEQRDGINTFRTGDGGYVADNMLFFTGRLDYQIKYKGYRIEPEEIESVILQYDGVEACAVIPKCDDGGKTLFIKAFVQGENVDISGLKEFLGAKLPEYMIPKTIKKVDSLPINANGKTDRKALVYNDSCL